MKASEFQYWLFMEGEAKVYAVAPSSRPKALSWDRMTACPAAMSSAALANVVLTNNATKSTGVRMVTPAVCDVRRFNKIPVFARRVKDENLVNSMTHPSAVTARNEEVFYGGPSGSARRCNVQCERAMRNV
jgi:hypothetical protein